MGRKPKDPDAPKKTRGKGAKLSKMMKSVEMQVWRARKQLMKGRVLSVDPSCHSVRTGASDAENASKSQPGWCLHVDGVFVESGVISIDTKVHSSLQDRLYEISRVIREELIPRKGNGSTKEGGWYPFDVVIMEEVPLKRFFPGGSRPGGGGARSSVRAQLPLHYACAVTYSSIKPAKWIKIPPQVWHQYVPAGYVKSDEGDARALATAAYAILAKVTAARAEIASRSARRPRMPSNRKRPTKLSERIPKSMRG